MFRNILEVPKKHKTVILFSLALMMWMLIAVWQLGGMSFYAFLLMTIITLLLYFMIGCLYLKPETDKRKVLAGGMVLSAVFSKPKAAGFVHLSNKQCITQEELADGKNADAAAFIPVVTISNVADGVRTVWNPIEDAEGYAVFRKGQDDADYACVAMLLNSTVNAYTDISAVPNTQYTYAVSAIKDGVAGKCVPQEILSGVWRPNLTLTMTGADVTLEWTQVQGATEYRIYRKETNGGKYEELGKLGAKDTLSYVDTPPAFGVKYTYAVRGCIGEINGSLRTKDITMTMENTVVTAANQDDGVKISWQPTELAESYNVYRKTGNEKYAKIANVPAATLEYLDMAALPNTNYDYAVRAVRGKYQNKYDAVSILSGEFPERDRQIAEALERVMVDLEKGGSSDKPTVKLTWNKVAGSEGYHIYRKAIGEEELALTETITDAETVTFTDEKVEKGKQYIYYVYAFIGDHEGSGQGSKIDLD